MDPWWTLVDEDGGREERERDGLLCVYVGGGGGEKDKALITFICHIDSTSITFSIIPGKAYNSHLFLSQICQQIV